MKYILFLIGIISSGLFNAQEADNNLQGYFMTNSKETLYPYFAFDGNGKVDIAGYGKGDYFVKNDSVVVFPDKDIFIFKMSKNRLSGNSTWVKDTKWDLKKDSIAENNRKDNTLAKKNAQLLYEYYRKTRVKSNDLDKLFDENAMGNYTKTIDDLCTRGLAKACMEKFGFMVMNDAGGMEAVLKNKLKKLKQNPEIIRLGQKIISMGEIEGHTVLGSYYYSLGDKAKATKEWETATDKGSTKAGMAQFEAEMNDAAK
ncbi:MULTISPECIES: hypothetical protein [Chryseobacterium]|uniref:Tetratricopeptide repeat protein n=1 Tax=Chryseobacterium geocarposphaerae TaxID=1416776 RepID=A0ABU1LG95_9FLAO|nr:MULTISPECIES: hypothetical protein [Chryseobacterium]MDR6405736.1 hypothetical protein [Chryseobacterium geocarposphaerae]MDR6699102.1 hypothetical protein [Chryseobacterium ginsenosidimutans]